MFDCILNTPLKPAKSKRTYGSGNIGDFVGRDVFCYAQSSHSSLWLFKLLYFNEIYDLRHLPIGENVLNYYNFETNKTREKSVFEDTPNVFFETSTISDDAIGSSALS